MKELQVKVYKYSSWCSRWELSSISCISANPSENGQLAWEHTVCDATAFLAHFVALSEIRRFGSMIAVLRSGAVRRGS